MDWQMIGTIIAFAALFLAILGQTMAAVYWAGVFTTNIKNLTATVEKLQSRDDLFVREKDYLQQVANRNREVSDLWKSLNDLRDKFEDCRAKLRKCPEESGR